MNELAVEVAALEWTRVRSISMSSISEGWDAKTGRGRGWEASHGGRRAWVLAVQLHGVGG